MFLEMFCSTCQCSPYVLAYKSTNFGHFLIEFLSIRLIRGSIFTTINKHNQQFPKFASKKLNSTYTRVDLYASIYGTYNCTTSVTSRISYLLHWICCRCDGRQYWFILPVNVSLNAPVKTQNQHGKNDDDPEYLSKDSLIRKER